MTKTALSRVATLFLLAAGFLTTAMTGGSLLAHAAGPDIDRVQKAIQTRLDGGTAIEALSCQGEMICGIRMLPRAYDNRNYLPLWIDASLRLEKAEALAGAIGRADEDGLVPQDYHIEAIDGLLAEICEQASAAGPDSVAAELWADLDLILTDAFLLYGSHLAAGRVNPETLHNDWKINPVAADLLSSLVAAASSGDVDGALAQLRPAHSGYSTLRSALARLRRLAASGGWPLLGADRTLRPGDRDAAVGGLRHRLTVTGDLEQAFHEDDALLFDAGTESAVRRFQQRHGLKVDGIVGPDTYGMLNVPVSQRIRQVVLNLERWRWLPHDLGSRYILVNTADFNLKAVENGRVGLQMRVVVGRPARRSPVFSARMTYLVVNPYWNVPTTIAVQDILPELQKDITYLSSKGIRVFENWERDAPEIDPATVDWQAYHANRFPFRLRQDPGPYNALGRIKFMFPNQFAVYLHDTPNRALFKRAQRDFSSGCIRLESPEALADFVLADDPRWAAETLADVFREKDRRIIRLKHPIPVHLLYMTAWVDATGSIQFRSDIYDRDRDLAQALSQRRPNQPPDFVRR
ncbi:L,D-transpeptidase family protein [Desulfosarcina alkanivorans]|uniref:L,D-transpeptidase family protein n=1 Tax=Desulfosarcina alkanivorans TaxID=571177 RepID=UPI00142EEA6F|nr:L,D-transpeptidase family protein [Desulfosarcina alkanivorans]